MRGRQKLDKARGRLRLHGWAVVQQAAAAGLAWWLANLWASDHHPFFAPIAAVVALNTNVGGRGLQAIRLIIGVALGIVVGSLALELFGTRAVALPIATLVAMGLAVLVGAARVTIAQAASTAVLTVSIPYGADGGAQRLFDAFVGVLVALLFSQVVFPPQPTRLVGVAEDKVLAAIDDLLAALARPGSDESDTLTRKASAVHSALAGLETALTAATNVAHHTTRFRGRDEVAAMRAGLDDLLRAGSAAVFLAECYPRLTHEQRTALAPVLDDLAARGPQEDTAASADPATGGQPPTAGLWSACRTAIDGLREALHAHRRRRVSSRSSKERR